MAASKIDTIAALGGKLVTDLSIDNSTQNQVTGGAGKLYMITADNTANNAEVYLKLVDATSGGSGVEPDWQFPLPASTKLSFVIPGGSTFSNLSVWCTSASTTANNSPPSNAVILSIVTS